MFRARRHVAWGGIIRGSVDHPLHNSAYGLGPSITWTPAWKPKHSHNCHLRCRLWKCCKHSEEARRNPRRRFSGSDIFGEFVLCENTVRSLLHNMNQTKAQLDMVEDKKKLFFVPLGMKKSCLLMVIVKTGKWNLSISKIIIPGQSNIPFCQNCQSDSFS